MGPTAFLGGGQETLKAEPTGGLPGNAQGSDQSARAGDGADGNARLHALTHQLLTGVRDGGTSRVGDQSTGLASQNSTQYHIAL